jgi:hypothetical protein
MHLETTGDTCPNYKLWLSYTGNETRISVSQLMNKDRLIRDREQVAHRDTIMDERAELIARIEAAIGRLQKLAEGSAEVMQGDLQVPLFQKVNRLTSDNDALREEVATLKDKRAADVKELDTLLAELKPLIEGAA